MPDQLQDHINAALRERESGSIAFAPAPAAARALSLDWSSSDIRFELDAPLPVKRKAETHSQLESRPEVPWDKAQQRPAVYKPAPQPPPWLLGFSSAFGGQTDKIDRKLQGRILEAVVESR